MSSKKNRNKNKGRAQQTHELTTEKLTQQLNTDDEVQEEKTDTGSILAEYERIASEAEQRQAEKLRLAEQEKAEKERERKEREKKIAALSAGEQAPPAEDTAARNKKQKNDKAEEEADVKQFVPRSPAANPAPEKETFTEGFNEALSENYDDLTEETDAENEAEPEQEAETEPERPNKFYLVFAVFVIIMSIVGVISTVNFATNIISNIANRTDLKNDLTLFLYPIVSVDPPDCDSVDELPPSIVVEAAIWRIILTGDNSNYERLYNTYMYVPAIDVEYSVRSMFGNTAVIKHQTVGTMDISFTYIEDMNSYLVPINPHYTAYSPRITEVTNVGKLYTVTVEYIPPSALSVDGIEFEVNATKTMVYTLSKSQSTTTLHSIKNITRIENSYEY